jgi:hypothetical protein
MFPERDPNATTQSFDAFTPAPYTADPTGPTGPDEYDAGPASLGGPESPYFAYPPMGDPADPVAPVRDKRPWTRSVLIIAGVLLLVCGIGAGIYATTGSSSPSGQPASAAAAPTLAATAAAPRGHGKVETARVTVTAVNGNTLKGTTASGLNIIIDITPNTKFGTKARPLTADQIVTGEVVIVRGQRTGTGSFAALGIYRLPSAGAAPASTSST